MYKGEAIFFSWQNKNTDGKSMEFSDRCGGKWVVAALFSAEKIYMMCQHMAKCEECTPACIKKYMYSQY